MDLLTLAKNVAQRVEARATQAKVPVAVCVVDVHGNVVLQHRMPGAPLFSLELSERKAYTDAASELQQDIFGNHKSPCRLVYSVASVPLGTPF